jgi:hypothetical protein
VLLQAAIDGGALAATAVVDDNVRRQLWETVSGTGGSNALAVARDKTQAVLQKALRVAAFDGLTFELDESEMDGPRHEFRVSVAPAAASTAAAPIKPAPSPPPALPTQQPQPQPQPQLNSAAMEDDDDDADFAAPVESEAASPSMSVPVDERERSASARSSNSDRGGGAANARPRMDGSDDSDGAGRPALPSRRGGGAAADFDD